MKCEQCGRYEVDESGRTKELLDYCEHCGKNLCHTCMTTKACGQSPTKKHVRSTDND